MWNIPSRVELDISLARCTHLQDKSWTQEEHFYIYNPFVYNLAKNDVFEDLTNISDNFPKILKTLSERYKVSEPFPKISEDRGALRRKIRRSYNNKCS